MTRSAGRVACVSLLKRLVDEGSVPLSPKPVSPRPEVAVLLMEARAEANSLGATMNTHELIKMNT